MSNELNKIRGVEKKRASNFQPIILAVVLVLGVALGKFMGDGKSYSTASRNGDTSKILDLINRIDEKYVDEIDKQSLVENTIEFMLEDLDPHSYYISAEEYRSVNESMRGNFDGIGVEFMLRDDTLLIVRPLTGGPSEKVGIQAGDKVITVDGEQFSGTDISNADVTKSLKGESGTTVMLGIKRRGQEDLLEFEVERGKIPIHSVSAAFMFDDTTAYIKVDRFANTTKNEFKKAMFNMKKAGMKDLVLDLRSNGGGVMDAAIEMVNEFVGIGELIVYTERRDSRAVKEYSQNNGDYQDIDLVVLLNQGSASASEIVAGALQDHDRAITVGRRSFGKGLVQNELLMGDSSVVRLTVARYFTPSGRCIQKPYGEGIDYDREYEERFYNGELLNADSVQFEDSLKFKTDMGRTVYGGGGIMPDVFVPIDTVGLSDYFRSLSYAGVFRNFGFKFVDENRDGFSFENMYDFDQNFQVDESVMNRLLAFAEKEDIDFDQEEFDYSRDLIALRLKAHIGKNLFDDQALYFVNLRDDLDFQKGLEVVRHSDAYKEQWMSQLK